jgi:ATP-binding cassette subfamily F protein uup
LPPILNAQSIAKSFGATPLFRDISFTVSDGDRIGLIGPNGSGKSTLLGILAGEIDPDAGEVAKRKLARVAYVAQASEFPASATPYSILCDALQTAHIGAGERDARVAEALGRAGFEDVHVPAESLSGGWKKRLALVEAFVRQPDVLLLDEPTNHLDIEGIQWLEKMLVSARFASVVVSHDRYFLENVALSVVEISRIYADGGMRIKGNYSTFLEKKEEYLVAQNKRQDALTNRVHTELEWLRRGPKARATKAKARIDTANAMISELAAMKSRSQTSSAGISFTASERQTKRLVELEDVHFRLGGRKLFNGLSFMLTAGTRVGIVGPNGSGKTTLMRLMQRELEPEAGEVRLAPSLRIVYFDQTRRMDEDVTLRRALAPDSDSVIFQDRVIHVASWAERFLFTSDQLNQPVERLSGGERARVLIAKLMLQPADLLLLDEPTNDLDIPTLEILEESLLEYRGALALVTHDRFMLDRVSTVVLGLDGEGQAQQFADYSQWESWQAEQSRGTTSRKPAPAKTAAPEASSSAKKKLSYLEAREYSTIEQDIAQADAVLAQKQAASEDLAIATDAQRLQQALAELAEASERVDALYHRWTELENKMRG